MALQSLLINSVPPQESTTDPNPNNKEFATTVSTFKATATGAMTWTPSPANIIPVFVPSAKIITEGKIVAIEQITWTFVAVCIESTPGYTHVNGANVSPMLPTTEKCQIETKGIMRKGDIGKCTGTFTHATSPPIICTCDIEIDDPGQTKILGS